MAGSERRWRRVGAALAVCAAALAIAPAAATAAGVKDAIRVGPLVAPSDTHVAIVGSQERMVGRSFKVVRGKQVVARGKLKKAKGSPSPWKRGARADLSAVDEPGTYRVAVGKLRSKPFTVAPGAASALIARLESIFRANADGAEPNSIFGPAHLNDAAAPIVGGPTNGGTIDVSGGWRDAGDAIKFTNTIAISSVILDYAASLDPVNAADLGGLSNIGVRYLAKAHPAASQTFIAQVSGTSDHSGGFRDHAVDDASPDPAFSHRAAYGDAGSGNLGAGAAGLASAAVRFGPATPGGAALLGLAKEWYERGKAVSGPGPALEGFAQPGGEGFSDWQGFMALAAAQLFRAGAGDANGDPYLSDAVGFLNASPVEGGFSPYFAVGGLAAADLCGGLAAPVVPRADVRDAACAKLAEAAGAAAFRSRMTAFGSPGGFYFGWASDNGGGGALLAAAERAGVFPGGRAMASAARDYLLGLNPWGASFLVGPGKRDAHEPHHAAFLKGDPSQIADGFVVGGPAIASQFADFGLKPARKGPYVKFNPKYKGQYNETVVYEDRREDFITSEVGIAYSASSMLLAAMLAG